MKVINILVLSLMVCSSVAGAVTGDPGTIRTEISADLMDNFSEFQAPFYRRFTLRHANQPLQLPNGISKDYFFPTLYGNVTTAIAMFYCDYDQAKRLMPNAKMQPVSMGFGRSLVVITSYRYNQVFGMPPYNEVAVAIPVVAHDGWVPPLEPLIKSDYKDFGFYVVSMPVTSLENQIRGRTIWGLNKVVEQIEHIVDGSDYVTRVHDSAGEVYLETRVPMNGKAKEVDRSSLIYSVLDGQVVRGTSVSSGTFYVNSYFTSLANPFPRATDKYLKLGNGPTADLLRELKVTGQPFQFRFATGVSSTFDLPDANWSIE